MAPKTAPASAQPGAAASQASRFGGMRGLLMGGLFAAALASIFGFGAMASVLGFLLQAALIGGIVYLVLMFLRNRNQPAFGRAAPQAAGSTAPPRDTLAQNRFARDGAAGAGASQPPLTVGGDDFDSFERLLGEVQTAYGREDADKLGAITTPEMLSYFSEEISENAKRGLRNEISGVKLLQGDLAEAWRENGSDYATVAIRYSLIDATVDRATGRVVSGDLTRPTEATELWTFRRDDRARADGWQLSAIQQAA
ncbi:MAG TPA: Tim44 domain-containing protein [Hyphomicrobium sp.]|nr:Tim44 domain-containing protein [Hyphomicrobium sp.]HET6388232.1 Tim44 domain-containing protein [Hyphomicrobium sp.]